MIELVNNGVGFTVTVTLWAGVAQPFAEVIYRYVTMIGAVVVFVNVSFGFALPPPVDPALAASAIPATSARVHAKVAPAVALAGV